MNFARIARTIDAKLNGIGDDIVLEQVFQHTALTRGYTPNRAVCPFWNPKGDGLTVTSAYSIPALADRR